MFNVASGTLMLSLQVSEREVYGRFIYLAIYPSIASKRKKIRNKFIKENGKEKKRHLDQVSYSTEKW